LSAPVLGDLADRQGRRKALLITILLSVVGYFLSAWGIQTIHLSVLFIGRFIMGLAAGNMSICLAAIADMSSSEKEKTRYFSYGSVVAGITFVLGPFLGGKLSDTTLNPLFSSAFPMWLGGVLAILNLLMVYFTFRETLHVRTAGHIDALKAVHNIEAVLKNTSIKGLYTIYFVCLFAWNILFQFLPALMVEKFDAGNSIIGDASALMGVFWIIGTICFSWLLHSKATLKTLLFLTTLLFALSSLFVALPYEMPSFLCAVATVVFFAGGMWPLFTLAISNTAHATVQGRVLGFSQSIQSLAMMLAPLFGGFLIQAHGTVPFLISSITAFFAALFLLKAKL
jgi:DHA1 family tetracycline resistance protein-like MFS transporter